MKRSVAIAVPSLLGIVSVLVASSGASGNPRSSGFHSASFRLAPVRTARRGFTQTANCTTAGSPSFVGIPNEMDVAGGVASSVTSGTQNLACEPSSAVVSGVGNLIASDSDATVANAFIGAGEMNVTDAPDAFIGAGLNNHVTGAEAFVGAGVSNYAEGAGSFVGGGGADLYGASGALEPNNVASGEDSFIGAGDENTAAGNFSMVGSGKSNTVSSTAQFSSVVGGDTNTVTGTYSSILGGQTNSVSGEYAVITGGHRNRASGEYSAIIGGYGNTASGLYALVLGGDTNVAAGAVSVAGGYHAQANHSGSFVWSDYVSNSAPVTDTAANQFVARSSGGMYVYSSEDLSTGVELTPGSGTWASLSDRNAKTAFVPLDARSVLTRLSALPIGTWSYKTEPGVRHLGPMAQDFYMAFGLGPDDRHITSIDEDGVALAAAKAISANARRNDEAFRTNAAEIADLRHELRRFEKLLARAKPMKNASLHP